MQITPSISYFRGVTPNFEQAIIAHRNAEAATEARNYLAARHALATATLGNRLNVDM